MLKYALLGAAMAMTAPALAQTATTTAPTDPAAAQTAPTTVEPTDAMPARAEATPASAPADQTAAAQPATPKEQVAQVVDREFGTYDKDGDGKLNETEFSAWMVALKSQTDPKTDPNAPATKSWNKAAFAQADKDKSNSLSKAELASFLAPAAKS